jgi:hypothetical protein
MIDSEETEANVFKKDVNFLKKPLYFWVSKYKFLLKQINKTADT